MFGFWVSSSCISNNPQPAQGMQEHAAKRIIDLLYGLCFLCQTNLPALAKKTENKQATLQAILLAVQVQVDGKARTCPADPKAAAMDEKSIAEPSGVWQSVSTDKEAALGPHTALQPLRDCCRVAASARTPPACTMPPTQGLQWRMFARASPAIMPH